MATIFDLIEVTNISPDTTYSALQGNYLGVVDGMVSAELDDGEFDEGDIVTIGGVKYAITLIQEPTSSGRFTTTDGTNLSFNKQSESNLDAVFLTLSNGVDTRYFIVPNDSYGDMSISEIRTGSLDDVGGNDAAIISTTDHSVSVVCFANGTLIEGADGRHFPIESLKAGDKVRTLDHGLQPITWTGFRSIGVAQLMGLPHLRPVRICQSALGQGTPKLDLFVSQQHRVLVRSRIAERMFGNREVLVAAKKLIGLDGIAVSQSFAPLSYHHLIFDRHEIIFANGALCESLYPGPQAIRTLNEILQTAGNSVAGIADGAQTFRPARIFATGPKAEKLARRHKKNDRTICGTSMPRAVPRPGSRG